MSNNTYSFLDISAAMTGPGITTSLTGGGVAKEGIVVSRANDQNTMVIGADGRGMHSLRADKSGTVTLRLLKTNPLNHVLSAAFDYQTTSSALHGQNTFSVRNTARGDNWVASQCAFKRKPAFQNAEDGDIIEWPFDSISIDGVFGDGNA
jgi:hypothetical protein